MERKIRIHHKKETAEIKSLLDRAVEKYNRPAFIPNDPISIPHMFTKKQDREISGLFAAVFAWGQRKTIIAKSRELMRRMDNAPYEFVTRHTDADLNRLMGFKHRTFNETDLFYFISFLKAFYAKHNSLEAAFINEKNSPARLAGHHLKVFHENFFSLSEYPERTRKHISTPLKNSSCKRLNMFLRWMVRKDNNGVDFGIWNRLSPVDLLCPLDVHVGRTARKLELLTRKNADFKACLELTDNLKELNAHDPVVYDFALFGLSIDSM